MADGLHTMFRRATTSPTSASPSLSGLLSTLIPVGLVAGIFFLAFLCLRRTQRRQYAPRTYLPTLREQ